LSQTEKFSSSEVRSWLENETRTILPPVQAQAQKHRDDMRNSLQNLSESSKMLLDNSAKEIEKRNMKVYNRARALNKLARLFVERLKKIAIPEQVSYDSLNSFAQETQKVFNVVEIDIRNWFPRISPFFILDRRKFLTVYEKSKFALSAMQDFVAKEYVKTKTLEETFSLIDELHELEKQSAEMESQKDALKNERMLLESEIAELDKRAADVKGKSTIDQLHLVEAEAEAVNNELKHSLRHLQKPFVKVQALALQGGGAYLTPDEVKLLSAYLEKPFDALASEEDGYPALKEILRKLSRLLEEDKLKLKQDKARKAEQATDEILKKDSLASVQKRCKELAAQKIRISTSPEMEESKRNLASYQEQHEKLRVRKSGVEANEAVKINNYNDIVEKIKHHKKTIETNVLSFLDKRIQIL
jgi:hypothetical protein